MAELTVASTTDTQKDIDQAAGSQAAPPELEVVTTEGEEQETPELHTKPEGGAKFQKRIDRLMAQKLDAERQATELRDRLQKLEGGKPSETVTTTETAAPKVTARPKRDDVDEQGILKYGTDEAYEDAVVDWKLEQKEATRAQEQAKQAELSERQATVDTYNANVAAFKVEYPDFDAVMTRTKIEIPTAALEAIIQLGAPEIGYHLAKNPELCEELRKMGNSARAAAKIGQIAAQLESGNGSTVVEAGDEEEEEQPTRPVSRPVNNAPAPIRPVGGSATKSSVPIDELPYSEYRKIRDQQQKNRYRR